MFRQALEILHHGPDEEAYPAAVERGEGDGRRDVGAQMAKPEADGGGVALELGVATGPAGEETGDELADGRGLKEEEEDSELGGVLSVLKGVEVAFGGAGAGPAAASPGR